MFKPKLKYYLYDEVCIHNKRDDFWVVIHGNVLDLTQLLNDRCDSWNNVKRIFFCNNSVNNFFFFFVRI